MRQARQRIRGLWALVLIVGACARSDAPDRSRADSEEFPPVGRDHEVQQAVVAEPALEQPVRPEANETEPLRVGGDVVRPVRVTGGEVDLRSSGCPLRRVPLVILEVTIDKEGSVTSVGFLGESPDECVARYLQELVGTWKFRPATLDGEPVEVYYNLTLRSHFR